MMALWLAACLSEPDPLKVSLDAYTEGREALAAGRSAEAAEAFRRALAANPRAAEVQLWLGSALAAQGDLEGAIRAADAALSLRGPWGIAYYNRACWKIRAGRLEEAAPDLAQALSDPSLDRLAIAADADLDPLRADPRYRDQIPSRALPARVEADSEAVFLGSEWRVRLSAQLRPEDDLTLEFRGGIPPELRWIKTVEDLRPAGDLVERTLEVVFRVEGAAQGSLGPWTLSSGGLSADVGPVVYELLAPPDHQMKPREGGLAPFRVPHQLLAGLSGAAASRQGREVAVRAEPGDRIQLPKGVEGVRLEGRRSGQPEWIGLLIEREEPAELSVTRGGKPVFSGTL